MESQRGDKVTDSLMAITVITVGVVNCFRSGANDVRGCRNTIGRVWGWWEGGSVSGAERRELRRETESGRRRQAMDCRVELSTWVMIRQQRFVHVRNEFHAC